MNAPSPAERMVCRIASEVDASGVTVLGSFTPLAYAAYMLAKLTHARDAYLIGFNGVGIPAIELSLTGVEAAIYQGAVAHWTFGENTSTIHMGRRGLVECVSPAQMDGTGAFNLACIGDYERPKVRLPGGAGSPEVVQHYGRIVAYFGRHDRRTLVERVDFRTGRRAPLERRAREQRGLLPGPVRIVTPLCVLVKESEREPFRLESLTSGVEAAQVVEQTGFEVEVPTEVPLTAEPTDGQLRLLRERIDPLGTISFDSLPAGERRARLRQLLAVEWQLALAQR